MIPGFSTRLGWERGWRSCTAHNSKDWRSENVNVIELNCKVVKKFVTPSISTANPPFQVYPHFLAKIFLPPSPPSNSIFGRSYPLPPSLLKGGFQLCISLHSFITNHHTVHHGSVRTCICSWETSPDNRQKYPTKSV